jgi:hypothetical protein
MWSAMNALAPGAIGLGFADPLNGPNGVRVLRGRVVLREPDFREHLLGLDVAAEAVGITELRRS